MTREEAEKHTIIRAVTGSTAHGLNLPGTDDRDEMGVCIEPVEAFAGFSEFEQYIYRSAAEREGKQDACSQPGDLDLTIYGLRKFLRC
jgi:predicted nucleotidyltransferase